MKHKHYDLAYQAHRNTSFHPDKRAEAACKMYDDHMAQLTEKGGDTKRYDKLFTAWLFAETRCASPMITGPAKFPYERNQKALKSAHKRWEELDRFLKRASKPAKTPAPRRSQIDHGIEGSHYMVGKVIVKNNTDQNRLQIIFPSKPDLETLRKLKDRGFKWSPTNQAWQRLLTPNAIEAAKALLEAA